MFENYKEEVLKVYQKKKDEGSISSNLIGLSPGQLRDECIIVYNDRASEEDKETLKLFFGVLNNSRSYIQHIEEVDIDRFRPVRNFINGVTKTPERRVIEILAWLIDFQPRPFQLWQQKQLHTRNDNNKKPIVEQSPPKFLIANRPIIVICIIALVIGVGSALFWRDKKARETITKDEKCMYWTGDHYEAVACDQKTSMPKVALNIQMLNHLKKITSFDTLTKKDLGKVWYTKINKEIEFFTDSGMHPVDTVKRLKPLTPYMLSNNVSYYRHLFTVSIWSTSTIILILILAGFTYKRLRKSRTLV